MKANIKIYLLDRYDNLKEISEKIDFSDFTYEKEINKIYNSLCFTLIDEKFDTSIVGDLKERIFFERNIDGVIRKESFLIEDFVNNGDKIKLFCKSMSLKYTLTPLYKSIRGGNLITFLQNLLDCEINTDRLTNRIFTSDFYINGKTIAEVIEEISERLGIEYYYEDNVLYFCDVNNKFDESSFRLSEYSNIIDVNKTYEKNTVLNEIIFNDTVEEEVIATPSVVLEIDTSPQPCSPKEELTFKDEATGKVYKMCPVCANFRIFFSPCDNEPQINIAKSTFRDSYTTLAESPRIYFDDTIKYEALIYEEIQLQNTNKVALKGGIVNIKSIEGVENYKYEKYYNVLTFDYVEESILKIMYKTYFYKGIIKPCEYPNYVDFDIKFFDKRILYRHYITLKNYFPLYIIYKFNLLKNGYSFDDLSHIYNATVYFKPYNGDYGKGVWVDTSYIKEKFGLLEFDVEDYGTYKLVINEESEKEDVFYIDYFINYHKVYKDVVS